MKVSSDDLLKSWLNSFGKDLWRLTASWIDSEEDVPAEFSWLLKKSISSRKTSPKDLWTLNKKFWNLSQQQMRGLENRKGKLIEMQCALIFSLNWPLERAAFVTGKNKNILRYEIFEALREIANWDPHAEVQPDRDCLSCELHMIEHLQNMDGVSAKKEHFTKEDFKKHLASCHRCQKEFKALDAVSLKLKQKPYKGPNSFSNFLIKSERSKFKRPLFKPVNIAIVTTAILMTVFLQNLPTLNDLLAQSERLFNSAQKESSQPKPLTPMMPSELDLEPSSAVSQIESAPAKPSTPETAKTPVVSAINPAKPAKSLAKNDFQVWDAGTETIEETASKVLSVLMNFGASKAADLELGSWNRGGRYYHFNVDLEKFTELKDEFEKLGLKEFRRADSVSSSRKTPAGKMRVVFILKSRPSPLSSPTKVDVETQKGTQKQEGLE